MFLEWPAQDDGGTKMKFSVISPVTTELRNRNRFDLLLLFSKINWLKLCNRKIKEAEEPLLCVFHSSPRVS